MKHSLRPARTAVLAVCAAILTRATVSACLIPVFQYALENWPADPYRAVIDGAAAAGCAEAQAAISVLKEASESGANLSLEIEESAPPHAGADAAAPVIKLQYPERVGPFGTVWSGALTRDEAARLLNSPARREIIAHLLDRKVAVWIFLESGHRRNDRRAFQTLQEESERLKQTLKISLPEYLPADAGEIQTDIDFSTVRINRDDPEERVLVDILLGLEPDLRDFEDQPMVFPVYGRGLALYALIGKGINPNTLWEAASFLTGPCSCQVKASNPGVDILLVQDWDGSVERRAHPTLPAAGTDMFLERMKEAEKRLSE